MELTKDSNVKELIQLFNTGEIKYQHVMDLFEVSRDLVKARLKTLGLHWDNSAKQMVGEASEQDLHIKLDDLFKKQRKRGNQSPKVSRELTNVPTKVQSNQQTMVIRKRSSFDIDVELMRELKMQSLIHDKPVYLIVENAIRKAVEDLKGS